MAGLAGVVYTIRFASSRPDGAVGLELEVIAAALFAGVSIFGGVGTMWAVAASVLFLGSIRSLLRLEGATANELTIVTGSLLLVSVVIPAIGRRIADRRKAVSPSVPSGASAAPPSPGGTQGAAAEGRPVLAES
jgi:rhamnose transport system permease protein